MKISQMLLREDFYKINENTLKKYYIEKGQNTELYIYPQLNAIVTANPSKRVTDYLLCEYNLRDNPIKRSMAKIYVRLCLSTHGLLSSKKFKVQAKISNSILIYPCNKKYRIFDFDKNTVEVIPKYGFSTDDLKHEIVFRSQNNVPDFVPKLVDFTYSHYKESIIDGKPLARVTEKYDIYAKQAYELFLKYAEKSKHIISGSDYAEKLFASVHELNKGIVKSQQLVERIARRLALVLKDVEEITLVFSHGDLQPGNIWIENRTNRIYIIDWESWGERSIWYDQAVLMEGLRPEGIANYCKVEREIGKEACVLLEDLLYQLHNLETLPDNFDVDAFDSYVEYLEQYMRTDKYEMYGR